MQLILLSKDRGHLGHLRLTSGRVWLGIGACVLSICAGAFYGGVTAARILGVGPPEAQVATWREELSQQQAIVDATQRSLQQNLDALALRLGQMNAHVVSATTDAAGDLVLVMDSPVWAARVRYCLGTLPNVKTRIRVLPHGRS